MLEDTPLKKTNNSGNPSALLPFLIFILLYIGTAFFTGEFNMPVIVAVLIASIFALLMNKKESFSRKLEIFCKGAGDSNIIFLALIFILAGAFAAVAEATGAVDSIVNLGISVLPANLLIVGVFVVSGFISVSMGTSTGTVVALTPIAISVAEHLGIPVALPVAAVIGGGMFGDNLSMISDTTIAAVRTQETNMKDKFKTNFFIILPAAIITMIILAFTPTAEVPLEGSYDYSLITILPYLAVFITALLGVNVLLVLIGGTIFSGIIGFFNDSFDMMQFMKITGEGIKGMEDLAMIAILISGMVEIIKHNGGIDFVMHFIMSKIKGKRGAAFGIAGLVSAINITTPNNTVSILIAGPLAKDISNKYGIEAKKSASILDVFSCFIQGLIPYGAQLLAASGLAAISPVAFIPYSFYSMLLGISGIIAILVMFRKSTSLKDTTSENM